MTGLLNAPLQVLGIDPGMSGAVCRIGRGEFAVRRDFKTRDDIARGISDLASLGVDCAVMELVHAMPGQGVCSMFSFGRAAGVVDGVLHTFLEPSQIETVSPQKWQNFFRERLQISREEVFDSRSVASKICPESSPYLARKKDHNTADAVLIACWKIMLSI